MNIDMQLRKIAAMETQCNEALKNNPESPFWKTVKEMIAEARLNLEVAQRIEKLSQKTEAK